MSASGEEGPAENFKEDDRSVRGDAIPDSMPGVGWNPRPAKKRNQNTYSLFLLFLVTAAVASDTHGDRAKSNTDWGGGNLNQRRKGGLTLTVVDGICHAGGR